MSRVSRSLIQTCEMLIVLTASFAVTTRYASWHQKVKLTLDGLLK